MKDRQAKIASSPSQTNDNQIAEAYFKEQVKTPGLFFCLHRMEEWNEAEAFVRKVLVDFPNLKVLVYYTGGKMEPKPAAAHLLVTDKSDFNLFGKEKQVLKRWVREHEFDLLFVLSRKRNKRCKVLTTTIKARLKAGWTSAREEVVVDVSLGKPGEKMSYDAFYRTLIKYFKQLNIKLLP